MYKKVLIASDPEGLAEQAIPVVTSLVRGTGAQVEVVAVDVTATPPEVRREVAEHLDRVLAELRREGVSSQAVVRTSHHDHIPDQLASAAAEWGADLIVLGSHRRGDLRSLFVGSVGHALARRTMTPILFVGSEGATPRPELPPADRRRVLVAVDHDGLSQQAIETAIGVSGPGTRVHIVHLQTLPGVTSVDGYVPQSVFDSEREQGHDLIREALQRFADQGIPATWELYEAPGEVAREIVRMADAHDADVIVVGSRRLATARALVAGSVAHEMIALTHRSVLLAGPQPPLPS